MPVDQEFSSKQILETIPPVEGKEFTENTLNGFYKGLEDDMNDFEMQKNQRIASSSEDLSKVVITA